MQKALRWMWLLGVVAAIYAGGTLFMRWNHNKKIEQAAVQQEAEADRKIVDQYGGGEMKVLTFYADPPVIKAGSKGLLCYGVASAKTVRIEPNVEPVNPSLSRCVEIKPTGPKTTYTMTATDARGRSDTRTLEVAVR